MILRPFTFGPKRSHNNEVLRDQVSDKSVPHELTIEKVHTTRTTKV